MNPDMFRQFEQLQAQMTQLSELARNLAAAAPQQAEGRDSSGWVLVSLGADGIPTSIRVRNGWEQRIEADRLGAAVMEASGAAIKAAMEAWSEALDDSRWWAQRARFEEGDTSGAAVRSAEPPAGLVRDLPELTEQVLATMHRVQQEEPVEPNTVEGADPQGRVTVELGPEGMAGCSIDPAWAARTDGDRITAALSQALRSARERIPAAPKASFGLDELAGDALATLRALTELPLGGVNNGRSAER